MNRKKIQTVKCLGVYIATTIVIHSFPPCLPELRCRVRGGPLRLLAKFPTMRGLYSTVIQKDREISGGATAASNLATASPGLFCTMRRSLT